MIIFKRFVDFHVVGSLFQTLAALTEKASFAIFGKRSVEGIIADRR